MNPDEIPDNPDYMYDEDEVAAVTVTRSYISVQTTIFKVFIESAQPKFESKYLLFFRCCSLLELASTLLHFGFGMFMSKSFVLR